MLFGFMTAVGLALPASSAQAQPAAPSAGYNPYAGLGGGYYNTPYYASPVLRTPNIGFTYNTPYVSPTYQNYNYPNSYGSTYGNTYRNYSYGSPSYNYNYNNTYRSNYGWRR